MEAKIPFHIQVIAKFYSVIKIDGNHATGEIMKFEFIPSQKATTTIGSRLVGTRRVGDLDFDTVWVHVGNDYFKLVGLWQTSDR